MGPDSETQIVMAADKGANIYRLRTKACTHIFAIFEFQIHGHPQSWIDLGLRPSAAEL